MIMVLVSQVVAGDCVEHAAAKKDGADEDVQDVEHGDSPGQQHCRVMCAACCVAHKVGSAFYRFDCTWSASPYRFHIKARGMARTSARRRRHDPTWHRRLGSPAR